MDQNNQEIRTPDVYQMETLLDSLQDASWNEPYESSQELEQAKLASLAMLEESWRIQANYRQKWDSFQPILTRLKRLGMLDKNMKKVYDLLSVVLYQYSYNVKVSITEEEYLFVEQYMRLFRMTPQDRSNLQDTLTRLRFAH
jgi:hypothetical protein